MQKLLDRRGETLVETLAAILIVSMSSALLLAAAAAASRMNQAVRAADEQLRQEQAAAERQEQSAGDCVTVRTDAGKTYSYQIDRTGGSGELRSYVLAEEPS